MVKIQNTHHRTISIILIFVLIFTGIFSYPWEAFAENIVLSDEIYYHLDMGVQVSYQGNEWEARGFDYGDTEQISTTIAFPNDVEVLDAYPLNSTKGDRFDFDGNTTSTNIPDSLKGESGGSETNAYAQFYSNYVSTLMYSSGIAYSSGNEVTFSYNVALNTSVPLEVVEKGKYALDNEIWKLFGGKDNVQNPNVKAAIENALLQGYNGTAGTNKLYIVFCPTVIEYKKYVAVGDLEANLGLPQTAKMGESYTARDLSYVDSTLTVESAELEKQRDDGSWEVVAIWDGPGIPGYNTGESIEETCNEVGTVTYRLTVTTTNGQTDTDIKRIDITDNREITVIPNLVLPAFTYEGHTVLAEDQSTFVVEGIDYSASRAYAEKLADNNFNCKSTYAKILRRTATKADATFSLRGTYSVILTVDPVAGGTVADTEQIEVRKTPYIIDNLSGFQKQNRKQILNIAVATYPGKPVTDYTITIKDKATGGQIQLTPENKQENNATIKTRTISRTESEDGCFTYLTVEFLTKTPFYDPADPNAAQDFYYDIRVEDSKGDTDTASRIFEVKPDVPPAAEISLDSVFLRQEGSNIAKIKAEDITVAADGDEVERSWYFAHGLMPEASTDIASMGGYEKLSFGTDKIIGFNKTGVGTFTTKLLVKEKWTEPTLEEYVTDADRLTGTAIAFSDVQNVAPVVSLELLDSTAQEILLLAKDNAEYQALLNKKNELQQALLANQIDGRIIVKKLIGDTPGGLTGIQQQLVYQFPAPIWKSGMADEIAISNLTSDSEKTYLTTYTWVDNKPSVPITVHAYNPYAGVVWSYTTNRNEKFTFGNDDIGKYLYLIYASSNQTVVLNKRTGAVAGTIGIALSDRVWISDNLIFMMEENDLYAINQNSLSKTLVETDVSTVARVAGKLQYITKSDSGVIRNILDMETLAVKKHLLIHVSEGSAAPGDYQAVCIDSTGKVVLFKNAGQGSDTFSGILVYSPSDEQIRKIAQDVLNGYRNKLYFTLDEKGECNHVLSWQEYTPSSPNRHYLSGINLDTGSKSIWSKSTDTLNSGTFSAAFEVNGKSFFYSNGWYYTGASGYCGPAYLFTYDGVALSGSTSGPGMIGSYDENFSASDRMVSALFGNNTTATLQMIVSSFPKTLQQETSEVIARFTDALTFVGDVNTTADQIKASAEAVKPVMKITAAQNGSLSLYNQVLEQNKKYYYDFEIKPLTEGTSDKLTGMSASTGTASSGLAILPNPYYVEKTYEEDFNDNSVNSYFTVTNNGKYDKGWFGAAYLGSDNEDRNAAVTFTVPAGKKAIVQFDYWLYTNVIYFRDAVYVDGERMYENLLSGTVQKYGHCVFQKLLGEGTHIIECRSNYTNTPYNVMIDNLKVEILSTAAPMLSTTLNTQAGDEKGWLAVEGSFETPNQNISYGAQAASYFSGPVAGTVTSWYDKRDYGETYPRGVEYTIKVNPDTFVRGYAYPRVNYPYSTHGDDDEVVMWNHEYVMNGDSKSRLSNGEPVLLDELGPGTYTCSIRGYYDAPRTNNPRIERFDLITYPGNVVTATGDIVFDSTLTKYYFPKVTSTGKTNLSIALPKGEYLLKNLRLYYIENGRKIYLQHNDLDESSDLSGWTLSPGLTTEVIQEAGEEVDDEYIKIYQKGEKVLYRIFYDDYENDASKIGYWVYSHINWPPDGVHPDAGKVLTQPIDRFYLSGKYTVKHWETDNTQRTGTVGNASGYDRDSNPVTLTFYVDGEGKAPWVTYIKTNPKPVKENNLYTVAIGVDDTEKDVLTLETEVFFNGTSILSHKRETLCANANGAYPETQIGGLPAAKPGVYQVVSTVSDYSGTGIKSYKFTVVSEGRITGDVSHTEQWDENRKKYNQSRFSEEGNREMQLSDYKVLPSPRLRGSNVFWSGEKFMLHAETEGDPERVEVRIYETGAQGTLGDTGYHAELTNTGRKTTAGEELWEGSLWDSGMINQWGRKTPEALTFRFTAYYSGGITKAHTAAVIVDSERDYWQLHRLW